jgi:hypothetical protein
MWDLGWQWWIAMATKEPRVVVRAPVKVEDNSMRLDAGLDQATKFW